MQRLPLVLSASLTACAASHAPLCPAPDAGPTDPDVGVPDARAPDPDAPWLEPDAFEPCEPPLVDEGDACAGWRSIPAPPCPPIALVHTEDDELAVRCAEGFDAALLPTYAWDWRDRSGTPIPPEGDGPGTVFAPEIVVTLGLGDRIATHGDVYAHPAAWRTGEGGTWHETVPPPSAFVTMGAAIGFDEALFVGSDAYVFIRHSRTPLGW